MDKVIEVLTNCRVEGNIVYLPAEQLDRKVYQEVAKKLELIGGKWKGGKVAGFVFQDDPSELLAEVASGEKRDLKQEYQFFETPPALAAQLVELAIIYDSSTILEPSAGQGAIIAAINKEVPNIVVDYYELMPLNRKILEKKIDEGKLKAQYVGDDFTTANGSYQYDRIIANPPFKNNSDVSHIERMYVNLAPGGRLVAVSSEHWSFANGKIEQRFREWLQAVEADVYPIPKDTFKDSGTSVGGRIIVIGKPNYHKPNYKE